MPLMKRPRKIDPERVYLARDGFADATGSVRRGERLRGSHRMVREHPSMWIEDVSDAELAHMPEPRLAAPAVHHEPNTILPKQLGPEDLVVVVKSLAVSQGSSVRILSPGDKIDKRDPIVRRYPDYFA